MGKNEEQDQPAGAASPRFPVTAIANSLLKRAFHTGTSITSMKLQRVLYVVAAEYAKATDGPLLHDLFSPWGYGPVIPALHTYFEPSGPNPVRTYVKDGAGRKMSAHEKADPVLAGVLDRVWSATADVSPVVLSRLTTAPGSAWAAAIAAGDPAINPAAIHTDTSYQYVLGLTDAG